MATGTVMWFSGRKGFGFIQCDNGKEVFAHCSQIKDGGAFPTLLQDQRVTFEIWNSPKGARAVDIRHLEEQNKEQNPDPDQNKERKP